MQKVNYRPTAKSYFSGAGLMDYGMKCAGIDVVQSLEIDPKCVETLEANFNHKIVSGDIAHYKVFDQEESDIHLMTFPCTNYSTAGDIHGVRKGEDLFLHAFRHLALEKPEAFVIENVPGLLKFPVVMEAFQKIPDYWVQTICPLDALGWLPQKRKRVIVIGTKSKFSIAEPTGMRSIKLKDIVSPQPDMEVPNYVLKRMNGGERDLPIYSDPDDSNAVSPTCVAHYAKDRGTRMVIDKTHKLGARPYTTREYARLQGVPDSFNFPVSNTETYRQIGNGVAVPVAQWVGEQLMSYFN